MNTLKLLLIEDADQDIRVCRDTVRRYKEEKERTVELVICKDVSESNSKLDSSFDGAIIDLRLGQDGDEGNQIVRKISELCYRIPIIILTGTPDAVDRESQYVGIYKKGDTESGYTNLFDILWNIYNTGLTKIMGGRGVIENALQKVFLENILPQHERWVHYGMRDSEQTERALLRHILNHLLQFLSEGECPSYPEEVFIAPPIKKGTQTGSMLTSLDKKNWCVVLSPACDLVIRNNCSFKTDRVLLVEIDVEKKVNEAMLRKAAEEEVRREILNALRRNSRTTYYHWLPALNDFPGGYINFRKVTSVKPGDIKKQFCEPTLQISPPFIKDIVSRFSSYYARQGQPDLDIESLDYTPTVPTEV